MSIVKRVRKEDSEGVFFERTMKLSKMYPSAPQYPFHRSQHDRLVEAEHNFFEYHCGSKLNIERVTRGEQYVDSYTLNDELFVDLLIVLQSVAVQHCHPLSAEARKLLCCFDV